MIGSKLQQAFLTTSLGLKKEVDLFRAFISAFNALGTDALAKEYHGNRYQVTFSNGRGAGRTFPRCELCDVMIINYPVGDPSAARITFNQAKVTDTALRCHQVFSKMAPYSFRANLEQWDLLSNRPYISSASRFFYPPSNLLSDALLPSVGTFGVFYPVGTSFDFAYLVADGLAARNNNASRSGTLLWETPLLQLRVVGTHGEITGACCLRQFGDALEQNLIGTPISTLISGSSGHGAAQMRAWLHEVLLSLQREHPDSTLPEELLNGLQLGQDEGQDTTKKRPQSLSLPRAIVLTRSGGRDMEKETGLFHR
ncbi:hypothetical protein [Pseudomonas sp. R3-18-08]|uniref:hypothetical protein n=1 Tax=Pseudomonas sp. R3-18-08 TaxID=1173283 RepID=UPI000F5838DD|nr:hypothetical protein [Pseudomonas sp. R3-18-08]AZF16291.1 hypothetical protein C4J92_2808 [Pseudomonas sp. R3-18-08]